MLIDYFASLDKDALKTQCLKCYLSKTIASKKTHTGAGVVNSSGLLIRVIQIAAKLGRAHKILG